MCFNVSRGPQWVASSRAWTRDNNSYQKNAKKAGGFTINSWGLFLVGGEGEGIIGCTFFFCFFVSFFWMLDAPQSGCFGKGDSFCKMINYVGVYIYVEFFEVYSYQPLGTAEIIGFYRDFSWRELQVLPSRISANAQVKKMFTVSLTCLLPSTCGLGGSMGKHQHVDDWYDGNTTQQMPVCMHKHISIYFILVNMLLCLLHSIYYTPSLRAAFLNCVSRCPQFCFPKTDVFVLLVKT